MSKPGAVLPAAKKRRWEPILLGVLLALFAGIALVYSWVIPLYEGPDEHAHLEYIGYLLRAQKLPELDAATASVSHQLVQQPPLFYVLSATLVGWLPVDVALANAEVNPYVDKNLSHRAYLTLPDAPPESLLAPRGARLVSLLGATLAVLGTWLLVRRLLPHWPWAAYVAAAVVGFNPQFLFSAATVTNDTWAAALPVWALWLALGAEPSPQPWRRWFGVGLLLGAAALVKYSALVVAWPLAIVGLVQAHRRGWRDWR
jgi:4-amino-4-deoxy-L-arabinose transferase-like glycosyltransferase